MIMRPQSDGGGIALLLNSDTASADLTNNIIWGNTTGTGTCRDIYLDSDYDMNGTHATVPQEQRLQPDHRHLCH